MSGLVGKRVWANVPGLGEGKGFRHSGEIRVAPVIRARSRALASRGSSLLRGVGCSGRGWASARRGRAEFVPSAAIQRSTQNWHGLGESDCLIKAKHCDGSS